MSQQQPVVIIIDDEQSVRKTIAFMLEREGMTVFEATNGNHGLSIAAEHKPDLIITDLVMPDKEGIETIREIRSFFPECMIIAMSGAPDSPPYLSAATCLGARYIIRKPFHRSEILNAVKNALEKKNGTTVRSSHPDTTKHDSGKGLSYAE